MLVKMGAVRLVVETREGRSRGDLGWEYGQMGVWWCRCGWGHNGGVTGGEGNKV